jgi:hypothetical protein
VLVEAGIRWSSVVVCRKSRHLQHNQEEEEFTQLYNQTYQRSKRMKKKKKGKRREGCRQVFFYNRVSALEIDFPPSTQPTPSQENQTTSPAVFFS